MKVLVIGGMGVIGGAITEAAVKKGYSVFVLSRRKLSKKFVNLGVKGISGNWLNEKFAKKIVADDYDIIVDTLVFDEKRLIKSLAIVNGHCRQYIYISTDSVYPHPADNVSENDPININNVCWDYGINKLKAEKYLYNYGENYNFEWTCVRPTITFGDTRIPVGYASKRNSYTLADRIIKGKPIVRFDDMNTRHAVCHTSIFGEAVVGLFLNKKAYKQSYHISDNNAYTYDEIFNAIEKILGIKGIYVNVSVDKVKKYSKSLYEEMIYDKNPNFVLNNEKIKVAVPKVNYHVDIEQVMKSTLENLKHTNVIDDEYNYLTDNLIIEQLNDIEDEKKRQQIEIYVKTLSNNYTRELLYYRRKKILSNFFCLSLWRRYMLGRSKNNFIRSIKDTPIW